MTKKRSVEITVRDIVGKSEAQNLSACRCRDLVGGNFEADSCVPGEIKWINIELKKDRD